MIEIEKLKNAYDDVVDLSLIKKGDGMKAAIEIEKLFNKRCKEFKQKYKMNVGVYFTPAENLAYTAMKKFQAKYGKIDGVSTHEYFTNSIHVPVWDKVDPFEKADLEAKLANYSNAGCIFYSEFDASLQNNIEALEKFILYAIEKCDMPYIACNVPSDQCEKCGYQGQIDGDCPQCGSSNIQRLRRVTRLSYWRLQNCFQFRKTTGD